MVERYVVAYGNPFDGMICFGPFDDRDEAVSHAENDIDPGESWWIVPVEPVEGADFEDLITDEDIRKMWREAGGSFHGPNVEHATMPEALFLPYMRALYERQAADQASKPLADIAQAMSGKSGDTLEEIAQIMRGAGYALLEPGEGR